VRRDHNIKAFISYFREFLPGEDTRDELLIYKFRFDKFIRVLEEGYIFRDVIKTLVYCNQFGKSIDIECERFWKAGLEKMFWICPDNINIRIEFKRIGERLF